MWHTDVRSGTVAAILAQWESLELLAGYVKPKEKANKKTESQRICLWRHPLELLEQVSLETRTNSGFLIDLPTKNSFIS